jgi:hypothetical protein
VLRDVEIRPPVTATTPVDWDFGRSFLRFTSDRVNHTPRLQLDALCRVTQPDRSSRQLVLTAPCLGESMYVASGLIHQPTFEFVMVAEAGVAFAVLRHHADVADDLSEAHRVGEAMSTRSGVPARVTALDVTLRRFGAVESLGDYSGFRRALLADQPMVGRTTYRGEDGTLVEVEYPIKTGNVAHGAPAWQVDVGPVPWFDTSGDAEPLVGRVGLAYLVYNDLAWAEVARRVPTPLGERGPATAHYGAVERVVVRNELFAAV